MNGAERVCATLQDLGADCVFGLPGTQNTPLYEALRLSALRSVVPSDEGAAAFMATGYARASGRPGVLTTIPGPGFLYALPGIAEAREDSAPVVWITLRARSGDRAWPLQAIDQHAIAAPLVKRVIAVERADEIATALSEAWHAALDEEPGPVMVELGPALLLADVAQGPSGAHATRETAPLPDEAVAALLARLRACARPLLVAGQGAQGVAADVRALAHALGAPVIFTCSGRGVLADDDPFAFVQDFSTGVGAVVPALIERADLVLVLGCKFTHNGSAGGRLELPAGKLVRVDRSATVLAANYPAAVAVHAPLERVMPAIAAAAIGARNWDPAELQAWRTALSEARASPIEHEPVLPEAAGAGFSALFSSVAGALGADALYTADAGLHQLLTRRYAIVQRPRGLLCPSDFQSMGFGLPGAIGAAIARPQARVVACIGDGGLALSAGELLTAVRERIALIVIVFNDRSYGLIRRQQIANYGHECGVELAEVDYAMLARGAGCNYLRASGDADAIAQALAEATGVTLVELRLADAPSFERERSRSALKAKVRGMVPRAAWRVVKRIAGR